MIDTQQLTRYVCLLFSSDNSIPSNPPALESANISPTQVAEQVVPTTNPHYETKTTVPPIVLKQRTIMSSVGTSVSRTESRSTTLRARFHQHRNEGGPSTRCLYHPVAAAAPSLPELPRWLSVAAGSLLYPRTGQTGGFWCGRRVEKTKGCEYRASSREAE